MAARKPKTTKPRAAAKPDRKPSGPHTTCTLGLTLEFCETIQQCYHVTTTCRKLRLSRDTVNDWIDKGERLLAERERALEEGLPAPQLTANQEAWLEFAVRVARTRAETEQRLLRYIELEAMPLAFEYDQKGRPFRVVRGEEESGEDKLTGDWRAANRLLEIMRPDVYADRQTVRHEGTIRSEVATIDVAAVVADADKSRAACELLQLIRSGAGDAGGAGVRDEPLPVPPGAAPQPAEQLAYGTGGGPDQAPDGDDAAAPRQE